MKSIVIQSTIRVGSRDISSEATHEGEGLLDLNVDLPAGVAAEIATKTDGDTCTITLPDGHGLTDGDFDVYWSTNSVHYGAAGTIADNVLSLDGGSGDDFPVGGTDVVVAERVVIVAPLTGSLLTSITAHCTKRAHIEFLSSVPASIKAMKLDANKARTWAADIGFDETNPFASATVATIAASNGDSAAAGNLSIPIIYDAVS